MGMAKLHIVIVVLSVLSLILIIVSAKKTSICKQAIAELEAKSAELERQKVEHEYSLSKIKYEFAI